MTRRLETPEEARDRLAQRGLSEREGAELWARVEVSTRTGRFRRWLVPACLVSVVVAAAVLYLAREPAQRAVTPAPTNPCALDPNATELRLPAQCGATAVLVAGDEWKLEQGARVARVENGARVEQGRVRFQVRPRKQAGDVPFVVKVSHAEVRVIGTVFVIDQQAAHGSVQVSEGVIEVTFHDGTKQRVAAGESASWPHVAVAITPDPVPARTDAGVKRSAPPPAKAVDLDGVMERLLVLRSQKRFSEAAGLLRGTLSASGLGKPQRERISYELGLLLEASGEASCAHWQEHVERFGLQRNARAIEQRLERCKN